MCGLFGLPLESGSCFYSRMEFPNIHKIESVTDYFQAFYDLNKGDPKFTYRGFAEVIDWPHSYLNDLLRGRKPLTLKRALEFSVMAKMTAPETERLITMSQVEACPEKYKSFLTHQLSGLANFNLKLDPVALSEELGPDEAVIDADTFADPVYVALLTALHWCHGALPPRELARFLFSFPELQHPEVLEQKLSFLEGKKLIARQGEHISVNSQFVYFAGSSCEAMVPYVENLKFILKSPQQRGSARSGFVNLPKDKLTEMNQRIAAVTNWILTESRASDAVPLPITECFPIKYDFYTNYAVDLNLLGYSASSDVPLTDQVVNRSALPTEFNCALGF